MKFYDNGSDTLFQELLNKMATYFPKSKFNLYLDLYEDFVF